MRSIEKGCIIVRSSAIHRIVIPNFCLLAITFLLSPSLATAGNTWDGGGGDNLWGSGDNWDPNGSPSPGSGNDLYFNDSARDTPDNNYTAWDDWRNIIFQSNGDSITISGNAIDVFGKIENNGTAAAYFGVDDFSLNGGTCEANAVNGTLFLQGGGNIYNNGNFLNVWGSGNFLYIYKNLNGTGGLALKEGNTVRIGAACDYSGDTYIEDGQLHIMAAGSLPNTHIYVGALSGSEQAVLHIYDSDGGTTHAGDVTVRAGSSGNLVMASNNSSGVNTFSGTITLNRSVLFGYAGATMECSGDVTGSSAVEIQAGTVRFTGSKSLTSDITIANTATLELNGANILPDTVDIIAESGGIFDLNNNGETVEAVYGAGNVSLGSAQLIVNHSVDRELSGVVSGTGQLVKKGSAKWTLSGANEYSGNTYAVGGTLQFDANQAAAFTGGIYLGETSGSDAATLAVGTSGVALDNAITVRSGSSGTKYIAANNSSGAATLDGTVTLQDAVTVQAITGSGTLTMGDITMGANQITVQNNNDVTVGAITGSGVLEKLSGNGGTLIIAGACNYGDTWLNDGTIRLATGGDIQGGTFSLGSSSHQNNTTFELAAAGTDIDRNILVEDAGGAETRTISCTASGTATLSGSIDLRDENLTLSANSGATLVLSGTVDTDAKNDVNDMDLIVQGAGDVEFSGQLDVNNGATEIYKQGSGTLTISSDNSGKLYKIRPAAGTVYLNSANAFGSMYYHKIEFDGSAEVRVGVTPSSTGLGVAIGGNYDCTFNIDDGVTLPVDQAISDGGNTANLVKEGDGTLRLNAVNTIDGTTSVNDGTLHMAEGASIGPEVVLAQGATLKGQGTVGALLAYGSIEPGASVGTIDTAATTWQTNGIYVWEINDLDGTYGGGATSNGWDKLNITGDLTNAATAGNQFTIDIKSLSGQIAGQAANFDNSAGYTCSVATVSGSIVNFDDATIDVDTSNFQNALGGGTWSAQATATTIDLVFTPGSGAPTGSVFRFR